MNHGEWISSVKPEFGPGISERIQDAIMTSDEKIDLCRSVKSELLMALSTLLGVQTSSYFSTNCRNCNKFGFGSGRVDETGLDTFFL